MAYQLQITTSQSVHTLPLDGVTNSIPANPSASYTLLDEQGNAVKENLALTKDGNNLSLEVDGKSVANIEEFYSVDGSQYVIDGSTAPAENMVISSAGVDASGSIIANGAVWQAESGFLGLSTLQLVGAGVGSAVALGAAVASGSDSSSSNTSNADVSTPEITSGTTASNTTLTAIDENSGANQVVYTVTATDENDITYSLSGDDASLFSIHSTTGEVTLTADPDYETQDSYSFTVVAKDEAGNGSEQAVSLSINDIQDEIAPTITSGTTATTIDENSGAGQVVYTVTATDDNSITYNLSGDDASLFSIDSSTGEVTLTADPDYENQTNYSFNVVATDEAGNDSGQAVSLDINDIEDETAPTNTFNSATYDETSNALTLTGTDMNTLLSVGESSSTDIKDNFNWDNFTWDIDSDNDDSNNVSFSLSDIESVYVTDDNTLAITLTDTAATSLESTTDFDALTDNDSVSITEGFSADTAGNVSTTDSFERDTSIVVFDLVNDESSNHSDRTFDIDVSYTIYIMVSSSDANVELSSGLSWGGGNNLNSDDYIVLVSSDGNRILGENGNNINNSNSGTGGSNLAYQTESGAAAYLFTGGTFARLFSGVRRNVDLWSGRETRTRMNGLSDAYTLTALPSGVMTSQGLA